ncbi:MAG: protein phosphatase 2C domain-containing protein [Acidobacteriota bacterium]|nr:protein phosphatase 2C domain-containing protein [Acidobacteriota bacterium]
MSNDKISAEWRVIGETVPGATHLRAGIPNQDSILFMRQSSRSLPVVLSVSDGHGSPKCFRSHRGSQFAVKKAAVLLSEFLDERRGKFDLTEIESSKEYLAGEFLKRWREAVESDLKKEPFSEKEFENLEKKSDEKARKLVEENPLLAYGATSLTVALKEDFAIYMQLGDGDILNVSATGEVTKPLPEDDRLLANETTSLCLPKAEKDVRFFVQKFSEKETPAMILLSTDGYLNSFSSEAGFFQAGTDILQMLGEEKGFETVNDNLKAWLEEATQMGSGDDCTVGLIYSPDWLKKPEVASKSETVSAESISTDPQTGEKMVEIPDALLPVLAENQPENSEDVTVTITIKKDKTKSSATPIVTVEKNEPEKKKKAGENSDNQKTK